MMDNLKVTHYRNGDTIPNVADAGEWYDFTSGAFCGYDNNSANADTYGRLYNFYAVNDNRGIAPEGWHVATDDEWQALADYLGGDDVAGGKLKISGKIYWQSPNSGATNASGFTALPGGFRDNWGSFVDMSGVARFWTSTMYAGDQFGLFYVLHNDSVELLRDWLYARYGLSVRCVKDQ